MAAAPDVIDPQRWGLPLEAVMGLADALVDIWERFAPCMSTHTNNTSRYGLVYLRGLMTMEKDRNYANIARRVTGITDDGQNLQQFMSDSPWSAKRLFAKIQKEIAERAELQDGMLILDECGDERAGEESAGAARQYIGREGKIDTAQMGVPLSYYQAGVWAMVDAELYLPECWFDEAHAPLRKKLGIAGGRQFATKAELGLAMIRNARANGLPFGVVAFDSLYGQDRRLRAELDAEGIIYMADVRVSYQVYLNLPTVRVTEGKPRKRSEPVIRVEVVSDQKPVQVRSLVGHPDFALEPVAVRHTERGLLSYPCAARRVYTVTPTGKVREEWLLIRQEPDDTHSFALSNAPADTSFWHLALWRCQRYFCERTHQDAKTQIGWDELVARKYDAWMHHAAMSALGLWFVGTVKLDWARRYPRDSELAKQLEVEVLPALSVANVRELLQAVLPLKQLTPQEAICLVMQHLINRAGSTASRLRGQQSSRDPT